MQTEGSIDKTLTKTELFQFVSIEICVLFSRLQSANYPQSKKQIPRLIDPKLNAATAVIRQCIKSIDLLIVQTLLAKIFLFIEL